ncbi:aminodeoxychorismate lyase [Aliivibrio sifiae]|uniref:Aminodeoxychorismate lyase n=1 Tax=Aliivibrio sifiae TaxID=566293 RepID=A0A2S7XEP8_9GAMM|nr:aminodeoxychorismate lyase [Aliivibrio sifiae]PQJ89625.1 aminodeoxychorismate lyase [Aliivibrio sifiae]
MYWVNGVESETLPINDRSTQYGDGFFTTMKVNNGEIRLWSFHFERLTSSSQRLGITPPNWKKIEKQVHTIAEKINNGGIKILISRGAGGRGYSPKGCNNTQVIISDFQYPAHYKQWQEEGIELGVSAIKLGLSSPLLVGMKHLNRLEQVLIKDEISKTVYLDAIVLDLNNHVIETSIGNLFWVKDDRIFTPKLSFSGVEGVMKKHIGQLAKEFQLELEEVSAALSELENADEVFITNALFEIVPINAIVNTEFTQHKFTHRFQEKLYSC